MTVQKSREALTRDEIVEILQLNTEMFKREKEFAGYIIDLAIYLLENHYEAIRQKKKLAEPPKPEETAAPPRPPEKPRIVPDALTGTQVKNLTKRYRILRSASHRDTSAVICMACGSKVEHGVHCPGCGAIVAR